MQEKQTTPLYIKTTSYKIRTFSEKPTCTWHLQGLTMALCSKIQNSTIASTIKKNVQSISSIKSPHTKGKIID